MSNKILVVDDDLNICELLKLYLENEGYTAFVANDGQAAVDTFAAKNPDLVLLDIMLPKMDGWQVCREIRKTSSVPIIMLTAKGETFDKVLGLELGAFQQHFLLWGRQTDFLAQIHTKPLQSFKTPNRPLSDTAAAA